MATRINVSFPYWLEEEVQQTAVLQRGWKMIARTILFSYLLTSLYTQLAKNKIPPISPPPGRSSTKDTYIYYIKNYTLWFHRANQAQKAKLNFKETNG